MNKFDFIGRRNIGFGISAAIILIGVIGLLVNGLAFGIEFKGGTLFNVSWRMPTETGIRDTLNKVGLKNDIRSIEISGDNATIKLSTEDETKTREAKRRIDNLGPVKLSESRNVKGVTFSAVWRTATIEEVREALRKHDLGDSVIQVVGEEKNEMVVRTEHLSTAEQDKVEAELKKTGATELSIQSVGPSWGRQLTQGTIIALILSLSVVLVFVSFRFEFKMGGSAVIALAHDVLIALGLYALVGREVTTSTIAAFLTILGYSMYDTIVVFDRVRENLPGMKKISYSEMVNRSINQVLRRSINTTMTSVIPVASLFFLGGETLSAFAFALLIGLISGSYSSIFIASPVLAAWKEREPKYAALRKRLEEE